MIRWIVVLTALAVASHAGAELLVYDGFDYTQGANLGGQINPILSQPWGKGSSGNDTTIGTENLAVAGLAAPAGNSVLLSGANTSNGVVDRISPGGTGNFSTGTLYYSLVFKVTDMAGLSTAETGIFFAGFNNSAPTATQGVTRACARLQMRTSLLDPARFQLGVRTDNVAAFPSTIAWDETRDFAVGETIFVVAAYEFNKTVDPDPMNDDVAKIWIKPDPGTFGAADPPVAPLTSTGSDISQLQIQSFFLRQVDVAPTVTVVDELRNGTSWADVTPPGAPACNEPRFDVDGDHDVDGNDFAAYQRCYTGDGDPSGAYDAEACRCLNSDSETDIDLTDLVSFAACASGPSVPADAACDDALPPP
ncbi:MAG: hypothetical protein HY718_04605 [Planctomycetes bacterium]|nr:hypothetical protein [Planctomycetota bacterium]